MNDPDFEIVESLLREVERAEEETCGRNRIRVALWNRDDAFAERNLLGGVPPGEFAHQLRTVVDQAARWRALVATVRAFLED